MSQTYFHILFQKKISDFDSLVRVYFQVKLWILFLKICLQLASCMGERKEKSVGKCSSSDVQLGMRLKETSQRRVFLLSFSQHIQHNLFHLHFPNLNQIAFLCEFFFLLVRVGVAKIIFYWFFFAKRSNSLKTVFFPPRGFRFFNKL